MSDLTDEQLEWRLTHTMSTNEAEFRAVILEVQRHRAMVKRLEELAEKLESQPPDWPGIPRDAMAAELRNRMRTP